MKTAKEVFQKLLEEKGANMYIERFESAAYRLSATPGSQSGLKR